MGLIVADREPLLNADGVDGTVGSPVSKAAEVKVLQLLLEGTLATYCMVLMAPRDSGGLGVLEMTFHFRTYTSRSLIGLAPPI